MFFYTTHYGIFRSDFMITEWLIRSSKKARLNACFKDADLTYKRTVGKTQHVILPIIHSVKTNNDGIQYIFTLPNGVDPKLVKKNEYVFQQYFGENTEIKGNLKKFVMVVHNQSIPMSLPYSFSAIQAKIKDMTLPILCGKDIHGDLISYDMADFPHLLVAGETGSGKSTQLRAILATLMKSSNPDNLRFVLGDLKRSEFHLFRKIAHVDSVCTSASDLEAELSRISNEMKKRGQILDQLELTHISEITASERPSCIVVCIDEVALLKKEKQIMSIAEDISAIGRALGVFLILSMQRPDKDVLNGKLKNNLTVRMAFRHSDEINSRITLGSPEAADIKISNRGRMYLKIEEVIQVQGPYLELGKAKTLLMPLRRNTTKKRPTTTPEVEKTSNIFNILGGE